jgi:DNA-binding MarR family transcriptional regulator
MYQIAFISRGNRKKILELLDKPKTATTIAKEIGVHRSSVSRTLITLSKKGFVKCLNPKDVMDRFYEITAKGKEILEKVKDL